MRSNRLFLRPISVFSAALILMLVLATCYTRKVSVMKVSSMHRRIPPVVAATVADLFLVRPVQ